MKIADFIRDYSSDTTAGCANQALWRCEEPTTVTGRAWIRLEHGGEKYALLFSNRIDSTYSDGSVSVANDGGGEWEILSVRVGLAEKTDAPVSVWHTVTFDGQPTRTVSAGEGEFCTDEIPLNAKGGERMCYEITLRGKCYPYHPESVLPLSTCIGGEWKADKRFPMPLMTGSNRTISARVGFLGDSITQGCGTAVDSYTHWAAKIAEGLPASVSVWDLGIGYARGYDAATDGGWLARAKRCDTVHVCFGINDLYKGCRQPEQVVESLRTVARLLKAAGCRVILLTVPPFNMRGEYIAKWYYVNDAIRRDLIDECDEIFDFADVLGLPAPNRHDTPYGGHPNAEGCALVAREYLAGRHFIRRKPRVLLTMGKEFNPANDNSDNNYFKALTWCGAECVGQYGGEVDMSYDALLLTGGGDVDPHEYGEAYNGVAIGGIDPIRDKTEIAYARAYAAAGKPILGICRGIQVLNVALGGTLVQHLPHAPELHMPHGTAQTYHEVTAAAGSFVGTLYGEKFKTNSSHHEAVKDVAPDLRAVAWSENGDVIEAVEHTFLPVYGVQWHPERISHVFTGDTSTADGLEIFRFFLGKIEK